MRAIVRIVPALLTALAWASAWPRPAVAGSTYLAIGDSVAFGEFRFQEGPNDGIRGYVAPYADFLATSNGGVRPQTINLAVSGETSTTFFNGGPPGPGPIPGAPAYGRNTNYTQPFPAQNSLLLATIAAQHAAGNTIDNITVQLGANDFYALAIDPANFTKTPLQQQAILGATLAQFQSNYTALLSELTALAPEANLVLLGYYDPFGPFANDPTNPFFPTSQLSGPAIQGLDQIIAAEATAFNARYIDLYTPFLGNELSLTDVANPLIPGNVHPTPAGYGVIFGQLVPEPSGLLMLGTSAIAGLALARRRSRRPAGGSDGRGDGAGKAH
jgi:lysophospholipase L1-like esterase